MPKETKESSKTASNMLRHAPLDKQIASSKKKAEGKFSRADPRKLATERRGVDDFQDDDLGGRQGGGPKGGKEFMDAKMSKKIMSQAQEQREEEEEASSMAVEAASSSGKGSKQKGGAGIGASLLVARNVDDGSESEEDPEDDGGFGEDDGGVGEDYGDEEYEVGSDGYVDIAEMEGLSAADQVVMGSFFGGATERRTINDLILDKIRDKEEADALAAANGGAGGGGGGGGKKGGGGGGAPKLPEKVVTVYTEIGKMLKWYSAGKIPKAFKIIPSLTNWEEVLWLTKPDDWSPSAVYAATRIFASNLNERMAQRFYNLILLGRVQADIDKNGRLNYHLYAAMRKAVYKPAAFYKGILLPLAKAECTIKEATVVASVLSKVSVPANHSAVCLLKLAEMPYSGPTSLFIRVLLNKKYALPHRVIDALVEHFMGFNDEKRELPVLWHQSLLVFAQRYKGDVSAAQKERLKQLFKTQNHALITPEVRREMFSGLSRGEEQASSEASDLGGGMMSGGGSSAMAVGGGAGFGGGGDTGGVFSGGFTVGGLFGGAGKREGGLTSS